MKTLKSVIKLTEKDIRNRDANKYVLTHHDLDSDGEMATKFVKVFNFVMNSRLGFNCLQITELHIAELHIELHITEMHIAELHITELHIAELNITELNITELHITELHITDH